MTTVPRRPRRVIMLGALSAIAEQTCRLLAAEGASLALVARNAARLDDVARDLEARGARQILAITRDLNDTAGARSTLEDISDAIGGADTVIILYGALGDQTLAEHDAVEARRILETNFMSAAAWALAAADLLERKGGESATLVAVTGVAGDRGRRSNYIYGAAKGGLSILLEGIAHRFGGRKGAPRAVALKLGFVDTPMTAGFKKSGPLWASPRRAAKAVRAAIDRGGPVIYVPWFWRWIMLVVRLLPAPIFNRLNL